MKKSLLIMILVLVICVSFLTGCNTVAKGEDALKGGGFDYTAVSSTEEEVDDTASYLGADWTMLTAGEEANTAFSVNSGSVVIDTNEAGYASLQQTVYLKNNAYYALNYTFVTSAVTEFSDTDDYEAIRGLWIGFSEDENFNQGSDPSPIVTDEKELNGNITIYFKTAGVTKTTLGINVGAAEAPVKTSVTLSSISLVQVDKAAVAAETDIKTLTPTVYNMADNYNPVFVVLGAIAIAVLMYAFYILFVRYLDKKEQNLLGGAFAKVDSKPIIGLLISLAGALLVRFVASFAIAGASSGFATINMGYDADIMSDYAAALTNAKGGTVWFWKYNSTAAFEPLKLLLLAVAGAVGVAFESSNAVLISNTFFIRLFAIIADLVVISLIYKASAKRVGVLGGTIFATLYGLLPLTFALSSVWGAWSSIAVMFAVLTFYLILEKRNYIWVALTFFAACMFSVWMIWLAPIVIMWTVRQFVKKKNTRIPIIVSTVLGFVLFYALSTPFTASFAEQGLGDTFSCFKLYFSSILGDGYYVANAFNFQALLGNNLKSVSTASLVIGILFLLFAIALAAIAYVKSPNRLDLMLIAAVYLAIVYMFGNRMQAEFIYMAIALLFLYSIVSRDKRVYFATAVLAVVAYVNFSYIFNLLDYSAGMPTVEYADGVMYTFSAFNLLATLYLAYLTYDITIEGKTAPMLGMKLSWAELWGFRVRKVVDVIVKIAKAIGLFFKTVFSKTPTESK